MIKDFIAMSLNVSYASPWHNLLIYYLVKKHNIIYGLTKMNYIDKSDIEDISKWDVKKIRMGLRKIGSSKQDYDNCPWCVIYNHLSNVSSKKCFDCGYGERHGYCNVNCSNCKKAGGPNYKKISAEMMRVGEVSQSNLDIWRGISQISSNLDIWKLGNEVRRIYTRMLEIAAIG